MSIDWLFEIDGTYYFSLRAITYGGQVYTPIVIDSSFNGIQENRIKTEMDSLTKSTFSFELENKTYTYSSSDFDGKTVIVRRLIDSVEKNSWKFIVKTSDPQYKTITLNCEDYLSYYCDGIWPTTKLIKDVFPEATVRLDPNSDALYSDSDKICIPVVFGTAYIPLHSVSNGTSTPFLVLGESTPTYTVTEVKSPHDDDEQTTYTPGATYTISQSTINSTAVFQLLESGDPLFWNSGAKRLKPLVEFSRSDTNTLYNVVDIIKYILTDSVNGFGMSSADLDTTSWAAASAEITSRGLQYHKGYYKHESRKDILVNLLTIADAHLRIGETIEIYMNSATPADTITSSDIVKSSLNSDGTFKMSRSVPNTNDSGIIEFASFGLPEDLTTEKTVPVGATVLNPVTNKLNLIGVTSNILAQSIGILYYQRSLTKNSTLSFTGNASLYTLRPGQMIGFDNNLYGGTYSALIDSVKFNKNSTIEFNCTTFSITLDDWGDISPGAVTLYSTPGTGITTLTQSKGYTDGLWDGTDTSVTFEALIDSAIANGATFIQGGYINTDIVKVNSTLIVGNIDWSSQIDGTGKPADGADVTQTALTAGASIDNASANGATFITGGYINTDIVKVNSSLIVGNIDFSNIDGATKPADNAEVNTFNAGDTAYDTDRVNGTAASTVVSNAAAGATFTSSSAGVLAYADVVNGPSLATTTPGSVGVYINRYYIGFYNSGWKTYIRSNGDFRLEGSGSNYVYWNGSTFAHYGGNVEFQSNSDGTSMLSFKNTATSRYFDFYPDDSGQALLIKPRAAYSGGSGIFIGDTTNTSVATMASYTRLGLYCGSNVDFKLYPTYAALNVPGTDYDFTFSATGLYPGAVPVACGTAARPWSGVGTNSLYVYGTASITGTATINAFSGSCISDSYTTTSSSIAASKTALYNGLATKSATSHNHSGSILGTVTAITSTRLNSYECYPTSSANGFCGYSGYYWGTGAFHTLYYGGQPGDVSGTLDALDDLQVIDDMGPALDKDGKPTPLGYGYKSKSVHELHPAITNFDDIPNDINEAYETDITTDDLRAIISGEKEPVIIADRPFVGDIKKFKHGYLIENNIIKGATIDESYIANRTSIDVAKMNNLITGSIRQLNKEVTEDVMEQTNDVIELLVTKTNEIEQSTNDVIELLAKRVNNLEKSLKTT